MRNQACHPRMLPNKTPTIELSQLLFLPYFDDSAFIMKLYNGTTSKFHSAIIFGGLVILRMLVVVLPFCIRRPSPVQLLKFCTDYCYL